MRSEALRPRWAVLGMAAALFTTGCATLPLPPGAGEPYGPAEVLREESATAAHSAQTHSVATSWEKRPRVRLRRRHGAPVVGTDVAVVSAEEMALRQAAGVQPSPQGPLSCGGHAVPEGWPDHSSWWDEELLAPFFQCTSPGEFLALQRRVDMPRLVEALGDWNAVRLGALGPMEAVREALEQRGFKLSDYPAREEQLRDVVRGLGRAADDVASTIPAVDGARGTGKPASPVPNGGPYERLR